MTNRRRYLISAAVLAACVCAAWAVFAMLPDGPRATKANFDRIKQGMTQAEVKTILGEPDAVTLDRTNVCLEWHYPGRIWIGVDFDIGNEEITNQAIQEWPETIPDKFRRWLHLPPAE